MSKIFDTLPKTKEELVQHIAEKMDFSMLTLLENEDGSLNEVLATQLARKAFKRALREGIAELHQSKAFNKKYLRKEKESA